jgi:hypothetical protein
VFLFETLNYQKKALITYQAQRSDCQLFVTKLRIVNLNYKYFNLVFNRKTLGLRTKPEMLPDTAMIEPSSRDFASLAISAI